MYCAIFIKNIFQLLFGYLSGAENDIKLYKLYNLQDSSYSYNFLIQLILIYDFLLLVIPLYLPIYVILFLIVKVYGNNLWFQVLYVLGIYIVAVCFFDSGKFNILFIIIIVLIGLFNWYAFKNWIR